MRIKNGFAVGLFAVLIFSLSNCAVDSCGTTKEDFLERYDTFMEEVKAADLAVSAKAWERYDGRFKNFVENCYESFEVELNGREKRRFWTKAMGYYYNRYGKSLSKELFEEQNSTSKKMQEQLQELWDDPKRAFDNFFE